MASKGLLWIMLACTVTVAFGVGPRMPGETLNIEEDPLDIEKTFGNDYRNWAGIVSQVLLAKENNHEHRARHSLQRVMIETHQHLLDLAAGKFEPVFALNDPVFIDDVAEKNIVEFKKKKTKVTTGITGISISKTFFTYAPALISVSNTGVSLSATGVLFAPSLLALGPGIATFAAQGIALSPNAIIVAPAGINVQPQALAVTPTLALIVPAGVNVQPAGVSIGSSLLVVAPTGVNVQPQGVAIGPVDTLNAPTGISVGGK